MPNKLSAKISMPEGRSSRNSHESAGAGGVSLTPPSYGLDCLDRVSPMTAPAAPMQMKDGAATAGAALAGTNRTGMPDKLKSGIESLSGMAMDNVRVHYNSPKPTQLQALAYAQGTDIHLAPGQERHLPHEAWHVVQQAQGRVKPTMNLGGVQINDSKSLEAEADTMGDKASSLG